MADEYALRLGRLLVNLHALEFALRAFLVKHNERSEPHVDHGALRVGSAVPVNSFTSYASLRELVDHFNVVVAEAGIDAAVDLVAVDLRDILSHGRVASRAPGEPPELLKFGKERDGWVRVTHREVLTEKWLTERAKFVYQQVLRVMAASKKMGQGIMEEVKPVNFREQQQ